MYVTEAEVVLLDFSVVVKADVLAKVNPPWVVETAPKVPMPALETLKLGATMRLV